MTRRNPRKEGPGSFTYVDIGAIDNERFVISSPKTVNNADAPSRASQEIRSGDVLFSLVRPHLRNIARVVPGLDRSVASSGFAVLRPTEEIDSDYLFYAVNRREFVASVPTRGHHSPAAREDQLRNIAIPLAPKRQQRAVVDEIEKQFTRLDAAVAGLNRTKANLKRYRAAVLHVAAQGAGDTAPIGDRDAGRSLPPGWTNVTLGELAEDGGYGTSTRCDYSFEGPPVIRIPNVVHGRIDLGDLKRASMDAGLSTNKALAPGDLLIIRTNGSRDLIGRAALVMAEFEAPTYFASYLIRFRIQEPWVAAWVSTIWDAPGIRRTLTRLAATSAGQYNLSLRSLSRLAIPLPPQEEAVRIIEGVEQRLSVLDELEKEVVTNIKRSAVIRESVLALSFGGEVGLQASSQEPVGDQTLPTRAG